MNKSIFIVFTILAGLCLAPYGLNGQAADTSETNTPPPADASAVSTNAMLDETNAAEQMRDVSTNASADTNNVVEQTTQTSKLPHDGVQMNFRGASLETVLNYMSEAMGFIIVMETEVSGTVDAWSHQPLNKEEAVELLNVILNKNGYAAVRNGRILTIVDRDSARTKDIPVKSGSNPELIPKSDSMVTQIVPVNHLNAMQLVENLTPLLPEYATISANESGNALIITDTQSNIRRMAEIVTSLDTTISSISDLQVFKLQYADATETAELINELFETSSSGEDNDRRDFFRRGRGDRDDNSSGSSEARQAIGRILAVADERSNALVVSAPEGLMPNITQLVADLDTEVEDITELRVFKLQYSDPVELAEILTELFPDEDTEEATAGVRFRGPRAMMMAQGSDNTSTRQRRLGKVVAVPDPRTGSLIVSAASQLMDQIEKMVTQLDSDSSKKQKVFVYSLDNADVDSIAEILQGMFESYRTDTAGQTTTDNQNALRTRSATFGEAGSTAGATRNQGGGATR